MAFFRRHTPWQTTLAQPIEFTFSPAQRGYVGGARIPVPIDRYGSDVLCQRGREVPHVTARPGLVIEEPT